MTRPVLVLGGGFAGLATAWHLHRRGLSVEVWEAAPEVGGWVQTLPWPGPDGEPGWLERGPQSLRCARGSALDRLVGELGLELRALPPSGPRWLLDGRGLHPWPKGLGWLSTDLLRLPDLLRLLLEPLAPSARGPETLQALAHRRLGAGFADRLWPALVQALVGAPPWELDAEALPALARADRGGGFLLSLLREGLPLRRVPAGGMGALPRALAAALPKVLTNHSALGLEPLPGGWRVRGADRTQDVPRVILALPPEAAAALLAPLAPGVGEVLRALESTPLRVRHTRHEPSPAWRVGGGLRVHPEAGTGLLGGLLWPADDPRGLGRPQACAYQRAEGDPALEDLLPGLSRPSQVRIEEAHLPRVRPGHVARLAALRAALPPGLEWVGGWRWGAGLADLALGAEDLARHWEG
jgi:protoporphyrinogen/coproporphyrinogen III oxidase